MEVCGISLNNADSECLGTRYRRRTHKVAICAGELPRSFDPAVSEWGNPAEFILGHSAVKIPIYRSITAEEGTV